MQKALTMTDADNNMREAGNQVLNTQDNGFRAIVENSTDFIGRFDRKLRYIYVNPALSKATGIAAEDYIGKTIHELAMPEEQMLLWGTKMLAVFKTGAVLTVEFSYPTVDGPQRVHARLIPEFDKDGTVETVLSVLQILTDFMAELRQVKAELEKQVYQQSAVSELGIKALKIDDLQAFMDEVVEKVADNLSVEYCKILELLPGGDSLLLRAGIGWRDGLWVMLV